MRPVDVGVDAQSVSLIDKAEEVGDAAPGALKVEGAVELVSAAKCLVQARQERVLMGAVENRHLVVIERVAVNVRQGIELQQRLRLGADRDDIAGKRQASCGIVDDDRLAERVDQVGKIACPLRLGRDKSGLGLGSMVARPFVGHEEGRPTRQQMWNLQRSAEGEDAGDAIVVGLGVLSPLSE